MKYQAIFIALTILAITGCTSENATNKEIQDMTYQIINDGRLELIDRHFAPDFVQHNAAHGDIRGTEAVKKMITSLRTAIPDLRITIHDMVMEGDTVAIRHTMSGTYQNPFTIRGIRSIPSGQKMEMSGMIFWRFRDGKVIEEYSNGDHLGFLIQVGAIKARE